MASLYTYSWIVLGLSLIPCLEACETGWFGQSCSYKCHCTNNKCDDNGTCYDGATCSSRWFGPSCQYDDLAQSDTVVEHSDTQVERVTDGNDNTCLDQSANEVKISWIFPYQFIWFRIYVNNPSFLNSFSFQFKNDSGSTIFECKNRKSAVVDDNAIDIHCDLNVTVTTLTLTGDGIKYLCTFHVSGGRNVALKQDTKQSSTFSNFQKSKASNAVDGNTSGRFKHYTCSHTWPEPHPNLNITFSVPENVNRYIIYNREGEKGEYARRLKEFLLRSYSPNGTMVFNYREPNEVWYRLEYHVTTTLPSLPVKLVNIEASYPETSTGKSILTVCEAEIFGDTACEPGKYGWNCEKQCNCADGRQDCFVSTGGCPDGCAEGYSGEDCQEIILVSDVEQFCERDC